jgi:hypothetical protein
VGSIWQILKSLAKPFVLKVGSRKVVLMFKQNVRDTLIGLESPLRRINYCGNSRLCGSYCACFKAEVQMRD